MDVGVAYRMFIGYLFLFLFKILPWQSFQRLCSLSKEGTESKKGGHLAKLK